MTIERVKERIDASRSEAESEKRSPLGWLLVGILLIVLSHFRWGSGLLAWVAPAPFLIYLLSTTGVRSRVVFLLSLSLAWTGASLKIITPPLSWPVAVLYGLSAGLCYGVGFLVWDRLRRGIAPILSHLAFAAAQITVEWVLHRFTPLSPVGAAATTQVDNLPFLQIASIFGIAGIGFLMYWFAAATAESIRYRVFRRTEWLSLLTLILIAHLFGAVRLGMITPQRTVTFAAVGTHFDWMGPPLPTPTEVAPINDALFENSTEAAHAGADLIAWTELATLVEKENESTLIDRGRRLAADHRVHLVMSYLVPISRAPLKFENKNVWIDDTGHVDHIYLKHNPVPLEPSVPGTSPVKRVDTRFGRLSDAICYDFAFPGFAARYAAAEIDLVVLPSSDTKGMDPLHTQIAAIRAIEGGYGILRPARFGLSAGIDPMGRLRGRLSDNESTQKILLVTLPIGRVPTIYAVVGDIAIYLALAFLVVLMVFLKRRDRLRQS